MKPNSIPSCFNKVKIGCGSVSTSDIANGSEAIPGKLSVASRKRFIDETLLSPDEAEKLLERRAYNRDCANRARKRSKQLIAQLESQVKELHEEKDQLRRVLVEMERKCIALESHNQSIMLTQMLASDTRSSLKMPTIGASFPFLQQNAMNNGIVARLGMQNSGDPSTMLNQYRFE